jgi:hypothetical protein
VSWSRRWRIDSREKLARIMRALLETSIDLAARPCELIFREVRVEKEDWQRRLFHATCADIAPHWGLTPAETKDRIKQEFYGTDVIVQRGRLTNDEVLEFQRLLRKIGPHHQVVVQPSEDSDREEYDRLINYAYQMASESEINLPDRRRK